MLALLDQEGGSAPPAGKSGVNINQLRSSLGEALERAAQRGGGGDVHLHELGRLLNQTDKLAQQRKDKYISSELSHWRR